MPYSRRSGIIMEKPILSPDFTIEDIHNVKEYNHYLTKDMEPDVIIIMSVEERF